MGAVTYQVPVGVGPPEPRLMATVRVRACRICDGYPARKDSALPKGLRERAFRLLFDVFVDQFLQRN